MVLCGNHRIVLMLFVHRALTTEISHIENYTVFQHYNALCNNFI